MATLEDARAQNPLEATYAWARDVDDAHIAFAGFFQHYPLYGLDLSNKAQYVGRHTPHGGFTTTRSCAEFRRGLRAGGYDFLVVATGASRRRALRILRPRTPGRKNPHAHSPMDAQACTRRPASQGDRRMPASRTAPRKTSSRSRAIFFEAAARRFRG